MPITIATGTAASGVNSAVPTMPGGGSAPAAGDLLQIIAESSDSTTAAGTPNVPTGYSLTHESSQGVGATGVTTLSVFSKIAAGGEGNPTVDGVLNHISANVMVWKGQGCTNVSDLIVGTAQGGSGATATGLGITTTVNDSAVALFVASSRDVISTTLFSAWTNANLSSFVEAIDMADSTGAGGGIGVGWGIDSVAGATGDSTTTISGTATNWRAVQIGIKPAVTASTIDQTHYRIRSDDSQGLNVDAGWAAALDTNVTMDAEKKFRIRFEVENDGAAVNTGFKLQVSKNGGGFADVAVMTGTEAAPTNTEMVEIRPSAQYADGDATTNILAGSSQTFVAGTGNEDNATGTWNNGNSHTEYEWTLLIRKTFGTFANSTIGYNVDGDVFEFRLVYTDGTAFGSYVTPDITLNVPDGLVGGTFPETPQQIGPFQDANGNLYCLIEAAESNPAIFVMKSVDNGAQWTAPDFANRPSRRDVEALDVAQVGSTLHILHQQTSTVSYHTFRTSDNGTPDTWNLKNEDAATVQPTTNTDQCAGIAPRLSINQVVAVFSDNVSGSNDRVAYAIRGTGGAWNAKVVIDSEASHSFTQAVCVNGASDLTYIFYVDFTSGLLYMRTLSGITLSGRTQITTAMGTTTPFRAPIMKPVYYDDGGVEKIVVVYMKADAKLYATTISGGTPGAEVAVTSETVARDTAGTTSRHPVASIAVQGRNVHVVYADDSTFDIWTRKSVTGAAWTSATEVEDAVTADFAASGEIFKVAGVYRFGYIFDDGSAGYTGKIKYDSFDASTPISVTPGIVTAPQAAQAVDKDKAVTLVKATLTIAAQVLSKTQGGGAQNKTITAVNTAIAAQAQNIDKLVTLIKAQTADTARALIFTKTIFKALGIATVVSAAQAQNVDKLKTLGVATVVSSSRALSVTKTIFKTLSVVTHVMSARAQDADKSVTLQKATEVDSARTVSTGGAKTLSVVTVVMSAQTLIKPIQKLAGTVTTSISARALDADKTVTLQKATEVDTARAQDADKLKTLGVVTQLSSAQAQNIDKLKTLSVVSVASTARALSFSKTIFKTLSVASVVNSALDLSLTGPIRRTLGIVSVVTSAQSIDKDKLKTISPATSPAVARSLVVTKPLIKTLGIVATTHEARSLGVIHPIRVTLTPAVTISTARALAFIISGRTWPQDSGLAWPDDSGTTWPETNYLEWEQN